MTKKSAKTLPAPIKETPPEVATGSPLADELTKNAPTQAGESPSNLRQRAEWFRRRRGGRESK